MWKAIRLHPWRLEIVPAAAFALAVWSAYVCQTQAAELQRNGYLYMLPLGLGMALVVWILGIESNHRWVQAERRKRFNWSAIGFPFFMLFNAWFLVLMAQMVTWAKHPASSLPLTFDFRVLCAVLAGGVGLAALLEWSRRYVPRPETPEPALPIEAADSSDYRETSVDWPLVACWPILLAIWFSWYQQEQSVETVVMGALAVFVLVNVCIRRLTLTPTTLTYWPGVLLPYHLAIADILSCVPAHHEPGLDLRKTRPKGFLITDGRCMEITLKDGRICHFGALRPTHICAMIEQARENLPPAPS